MVSTHHCTTSLGIGVKIPAYMYPIEHCFDHNLHQSTRRPKLDPAYSSLFIQRSLRAPIVAPISWPRGSPRDKTHIHILLQSYSKISDLDTSARRTVRTLLLSCIRNTEENEAGENAENGQGSGHEDEDVEFPGIFYAVCDVRTGGMSRNKVGISEWRHFGDRNRPEYC